MGTFAPCPSPCADLNAAKFARLAAILSASDIGSAGVNAASNPGSTSPSTGCAVLSALAISDNL